MIKYLWLAVTNDYLELPVAVADTAKELLTMLGIKRSGVMIAATRTSDFKSKSRKIYRIDVEQNFLKELEKESQND